MLSSVEKMLVYMFQKNLKSSTILVQFWRGGNTAPIEVTDKFLIVACKGAAGSSEATSPSLPSWLGDD